MAIRIKERNMEKHTLLSVSPYVHKYYLNEIYKDLPNDVIEILRAKLGVIAEKTNSIITIGFYENGEIFMEEHSQDPTCYDDIGAALEIKKFQAEEVETLKSIKMWYMIYHTSNGAIVRDILVLQAQGKAKEEVERTIINKYGEEHKAFIDMLLAD